MRICASFDAMRFGFITALPHALPFLPWITGLFLRRFRLTYPHRQSHFFSLLTALVTLLASDGARAAVFINSSSGEVASAAPALVPGFPLARVAADHKLPGVYEGAHSQGSVVFVLVAENLQSYADLLERRRKGAAPKTADAMLAIEVDPQVPVNELVGNGPEMPIHGFTTFGASAASKLALAALCGGSCGKGDPYGPLPGDQLNLNMSPSDVPAFESAVLWLHSHHLPVTQATINAFFGYSTTPNCANGFNPPRVPPVIGPTVGASFAGTARSGPSQPRSPSSSAQAALPVVVPGSSGHGGASALFGQTRMSPPSEMEPSLLPFQPAKFPPVSLAPAQRPRRFR